MKIFVLTHELSEKHGYGRYSIDLMHALKEGGLEISLAQRLPPSLKYKQTYFLAWWYALRLFSKARRCDVIHVYVEPYAYIGYILSLVTGKPYVVTAHGTFGVLPYTLSRYARYFHHKALSHAAAVVCVSAYTKKRLAAYGLTNLRVIDNGIRIDAKYGEKERTPKTESIIGVGALKHRKGYHVSIRAFAEVKKEYPNLVYYIVGNQDDVVYYRKLKELTKELSLEDSVIFKHGISDDELDELYRQARVFVLTPVSEGAHFEGFGLVYLEANLRRLPVVGSIDSGAESAIKEGETGFLVPQGDVRLITERVMNLLKDKAHAKGMGERGFQWAREHDWRVVGEKYVDLYEKTKTQ